MLKVQPQFKLDRSFRGPYRVYTVTDTCAHIRPIDKPNDDLITVSLQRLSRCRNGEMNAVTPWMGHGKSRRRRELRSAKKTDNSQSLNDSVAVSIHTEPSSLKTRQGRLIRKPARYLAISSCPQVSASQEGESCEVRVTDDSRESRESRDARWEERGKN